MPVRAFLFAICFFYDKIILCESREERNKRDDGLSQWLTDFFVWVVPLSRDFFDKFTHKNIIHFIESP